MTWRKIGYQEANKVFSLRLSTESNTDMNAEQRASPQRVHKFSRVCTAACIVHRRTVSFGGSGLLMTAPKHFEAFAVEPVLCKVHRRCDHCISLE